MKKWTWVLLGVLVSAAVFFASSRSIMQSGTYYRVDSLEYRGREVTAEEVDMEEVFDLLWTARMGRLPGGNLPHTNDGVKIDLVEEPNGGPLLRIVLSEKTGCRVYTGGKTYSIPNGEELLDAMLELMPS